MNYLSIGFIGGVLAFAHCLGMCGGFALHLSQNQSRLGMIYRQLLWNVGRTLTYVFLGALAGFIGYRINLIDRLSGIQTILTYVTGAVMILMGALSLGLIPTRRKKSPNISERFFVDIFQQIFIRPTSLAAFVLGLATGFLPCPIVVAFLALSIKSGSVSTGMATMAAMGLGTMWSLLLVGLTGHWINLRFKKWSTTVGGVVLVLLGSATIGRGTDVFHHLLGCTKTLQKQSADLSSTCGSAENRTIHPCCRHKQENIKTHLTLPVQE